MMFQYIRTVYEALREEERIKLNEYLRESKVIADAKLRVVAGGLAGKGSYRYKSNRKVRAVDLRNWKWVEVKSKDGFDCVISLNMLDFDPKTKNIHSLYDRIGFVLSPDPKDWVHTSIDLPLSEEDMKEIARLVKEQYDIYCKKQKEEKK